MNAIDPKEISQVEFCVCLEPEEKEVFLTVPVSAEVQGALKEMLVDTIKEWDSIDSGWIPFEYAEQYAHKEKIKTPTDGSEFEKLKLLFGLKNLTSTTDIVGSQEDLIYYLVIYTMKNGERYVGVKRATQLKGLLSARGRLIRWLGDSLKILDMDVLKLDSDFDFVIDDKHVFILRTSGFEYIADVDEKTLSKAAEKAIGLQTKLPFIDFTGIADYVGTHKRSARLVAALSARNDLNEISAEKLKDWAKNTDVELEEEKGIIRPAKGSEEGLLQIIDYRRYSVNIDMGEVKVFIAQSRRPAKRKSDKPKIKAGAKDKEAKKPRKKKGTK